jgi:Flp pilus assembly protein TadG
MRRHERALKLILRDDSGAAAVTVALALLPLSLAALGGIDLQRGLSARSQLQDALDAAALAAARDFEADPDEVQRAGRRALVQNLGPAPDATLTGSGDFTVGEDGKIVAQAAATIDTLLAQYVMGKKLTVSARSEVSRAGSNLEVALVLDLTGSMAGGKLADLKTAASQLIDVVVQDDQTPFYSKVALAPYANAVNVAGQADAVRGPYSVGCTSLGCADYEFDTAASGRKTFSISSCVTERTGAEAYTDASPGSARLGLNYPGPGNGCVASPVVPLTSDRDLLKSSITGFSAAGSTAGHIGTAWGWYLVSPNFADLWAGEGKPAAYGSKDLLKVVILMTDGLFNTTYANGVISRDSTSGSGAAADHINLDATNGSSPAQTRRLCANMKAAGVVVFTVGFDMHDQSARALLSECATDPSHVYFPADDGRQLKDVFRVIAARITNLHLSK